MLIRALAVFFFSCVLLKNGIVLAKRQSYELSQVSMIIKNDLTDNLDYRLIGLISGGMMQVASTKRTKTISNCQRMKFNARFGKDRSLQLTTMVLSDRHCTEPYPKNINDDNHALMAYRHNRKIELVFSHLSEVRDKKSSKIYVIPTGNSNQTNGCVPSGQNNCGQTYYMVTKSKSKAFYAVMNDKWQFQMKPLGLPKVKKSKREFFKKVKARLEQIRSEVSGASSMKSKYDAPIIMRLEG